MYQKKVTLCGSNAYQKKYYLNEDFQGLPDQVKDELKIACVLYTEEVGGILTVEFDEDGKLSFVTQAEENDFFYDEIGGALKIKQMQQEKRDLWESLELYYKVFFLGEEEEVKKYVISIGRWEYKYYDRCVPPERNHRVFPYYDKDPENIG